MSSTNKITSEEFAGGPGLNPNTTRVPHLRDSLIVAKVGLRAGTREPLSSFAAPYQIPPSVRHNLHDGSPPHSPGKQSRTICAPMHEAVNNVR